MDEFFKKSTFEKDGREHERPEGGRWVGLGAARAFGESGNFRRFCIFVVAPSLEVQVGCATSLHYF